MPTKRSNETKIQAQDIEIALMERFDYRKNLMVPNVQAGMGLHECDMLMLRPTGYATEFEIKISLSDLRKDKKKEHGHDSDLIKDMFYAVPDFLVSEAMRTVPVEYGIVWVKRVSMTEFVADIRRDPQSRQGARKWTDEERYQLARLGTMRMLKLKKENQRLKRSKGL